MNKPCFFLVALLLFPVIATNEVESFSGAEGLEKSISHILPLTVVFVGFREEVVATNTIDANIQKNHQLNQANYCINYSFNVSYHFANSSYYAGLKNFVLANSVNGTNTTSALNTTALQIQKTTGTKMSIFIPQSGRAINATAVEEWFVRNPYKASSEPSYLFYVINFTELNSPDHGLKHWYNTTELDFEANRLRDFWRLEWDNALNPHVKFPYACFTSQSRIFIIDPSAFHWYLTWARVWWGLSASGSKYEYYYKDLDEFLASNNVSTSPGKTALAHYLAGWIDDGLQNLLAPSLWTNIGISKAKTVSIQALILNNASDFGYSNDAMSWIFNSTLVEEAISDLAPFLDVEILARFANLADHPQLKTIFDHAVVEKNDGWTYYDGMRIFFDLHDVRELFFNFTAADVVINGYVYLEKNMSMRVYGGEYTGLGGGGQILVMKEIGRYFEEDGVTPRSGLGMVFIHEAGHNLGFPHTFIDRVAYAGDFAFDVMGYYPYSYLFTQLRKDSFRRLIVDYKFLGLQETLEEDSNLYSRKPPASAIDTEFNKVYAKMNETLELYDELNYLGAHEKIEEAEKIELHLHKLIWIYICDLNDDGIVDIFDLVPIAAAYGSTPGDNNWNSNADLVQDDIVDIFDLVAVAGNYGEELPNN